MKNLAVIFILMMIGIPFVLAQDPGVPGGDPDVPIDGGWCLILMAGLLYCLRFVKKE